MGKKFKLEFDGLEKMMEQMKELNGDLRKTSETALVETFNAVTPGIKAAMSKHHRTGATESSIVEQPTVEWNGNVAAIPIGFKISNGGLPSIFLMYGTTKMAPDRSLYNAVYGKATREKVADVQRQVFFEEIERLMLK